MHIFIIGPTASGKTTIGKKLAQLLNMNFIDTDKEIEKSTGVSINWLFDIEGEEGEVEDELTDPNIHEVDNIYVNWGFFEDKIS